jgi:hypothetical protein
MSKLYFGVCPYGTIADVFINTLAGWSSEWLQPCTPDITDVGHLVHNKHQDYVLSLSNNQPMTFRDQDYTDRLDEIENVLEQAGDKKVWIGSFHSKQARLIKKHFGEDATTVGISYGPSTHKVVLDTVLGYYVDYTTPRHYYVETMSKYYADKSTWDKLVPINFTPDTDISIDVEQFFSPDNYLQAIEAIDGKRNREQLAYYFEWLYKTKERLHESI